MGPELIHYKVVPYFFYLNFIPHKKRKIMSTTNHITTKWVGEMAFESNNPSGLDLRIDAGPESGGEGSGYRPKALMLSALAGCSGLDVASLIKKMKLKVDDFQIETIANLTDEHPKYYDAVTVEYHFHGKELDEKKLQRAVDLSVEKYCGVMEMFRQFAKLEIKTIFHS
tara:strand:- start:6420 stop:6926 length:507 start_codon:yes stop_codon:yes gene_type:complete